MSRRQAALRFGVSAASAVRWQKQFSEMGTVQPDKQGGDRRSKHIDAHAATILALCEATPDITLAEIKASLADKGFQAGIGTSRPRSRIQAQVRKWEVAQRGTTNERSVFPICARRIA